MTAWWSWACCRKARCCASWPPSSRPASSRRTSWPRRRSRPRCWTRCRCAWPRRRTSCRIAYRPGAQAPLHRDGRAAEQGAGERDRPRHRHEGGLRVRRPAQRHPGGHQEALLRRPHRLRRAGVRAARRRCSSRTCRKLAGAYEGSATRGWTRRRASSASGGGLAGSSSGSTSSRMNPTQLREALGAVRGTVGENDFVETLNILVGLLEMPRKDVPRALGAGGAAVVADRPAHGAAAAASVAHTSIAAYLHDLGKRPDKPLHPAAATPSNPEWKAEAKRYVPRAHQALRDGAPAGAGERHPRAAVRGLRRLGRSPGRQGRGHHRRRAHHRRGGRVPRADEQPVQRARPGAAPSTRRSTTCARRRACCSTRWWWTRSASCRAATCCGSASTATAARSSWPTPTRPCAPT